MTTVQLVRQREPSIGHVLRNDDRREDGEHCCSSDEGEDGEVDETVGDHEKSVHSALQSRH